MILRRLERPEEALAWIKKTPENRRIQLLAACSEKYPDNPGRKPYWPTQTPDKTRRADYGAWCSTIPLRDEVEKKHWPLPDRLS